MAIGVSAHAETFSGTVIDPQQRPIAGAHVTLTCDQHTGVRITNEQGYFSFAGIGFADDCKIQASYKGFAPRELAIERRRFIVIELRLAEVLQTITAKSDPTWSSSVSSVSLSSNELKSISDNSDDLIAYAKRLAGVYSGSDHIYVDGLPSEQLPPAQNIKSITINDDPFSAEYSDGTGAHIDIITKSPDSKLHFYAGGIPLGGTARDGLDPHLKSSSNTATLGLSGPIPGLPLAFNSDLDFSHRRRELPIEASVPSVPAFPITTEAAAPAMDSNLLAAAGAHYATNEVFRVDSSVYFAAGRHTNTNVSGSTLPEAGTDMNTAAHEIRTTITKAGAHYIYRGGIVADWLSRDSKANSAGLGVSVPGAFVAGGAPIKSADRETMKWTLKNVFSLDTGKRSWNFGVTISRSVDEQTVVPNPAGSIQFPNLEDYVLSAATGAPTGTALVVRGNGTVQYASYLFAPFIEGEILRKHEVSVRGGLRADYETRGGWLPSPRLSMTASILHRVVVRAGSGMFVQGWNNDVFLSLLENDGHHLHRVSIPSASLADILAAGAFQSEITSQIASRFTLPREWMSRISVERSFKGFSTGLEYTWADDSHLLGSERLGAVGGWMDLLESNRARNEQQLHFKAQCKFAGQSLTGQYEWSRSFDDTEGPFSFPAISGDLKAEWARSSGVSPHIFAIADNFQLRGDVFINLIGSWRSSAPYNITTGLDPQHNGLFNDRGGLPRNSGESPPYRNISVYASRRVRMRFFGKESQKGLYANLRVQAENILGNHNYVALDAVKSSPIFGQPLSALSGRSIRLRVNLSR